MWYLGIIVVIIMFVYYIRSSKKNDDKRNIKEYRQEPPKIEHEVRPPEPNRSHRIHRPVSYRDNGPMRTSRHSSRPVRERQQPHESNGTPRGGGTAGSRGSSSNSAPSGGRR